MKIAGRNFPFSLRALLPLAGLAALLSLSACIGIKTPFPLPTDTHTPLPPTGTATIVWFPPTNTPTVYVTPERSATPDLSPFYGDELYTDDFSTSDLWTTSLGPDGNIAIGNNAISLAVSKPNGSLISLRSEPFLSDFYAEIDATPNLCTADDMYGLTFWSVSEKIYYRYALNCSGMFRVDRVSLNGTTKIIEWTASGQISRGPQASSRIALWAGGGQLRFYANGIFQGYVIPPKTGAGVLGVFIQASGASPVSASFSNLAIYDVNPAYYLPTFTPIPSPTRTLRPDIPTSQPTRTRTPRPGNP
jgi:hypothetical protein